jgi:hypothetical protein
VPGDGHAGFGERPGETDPEQSRHRAPGRLNRWGWTLQLHGDGTTTATSPSGNKILHSHGPPGQDPLWADAPGHSPPATAA